MDHSTQISSPAESLKPEQQAAAAASGLYMLLFNHCKYRKDPVWWRNSNYFITVFNLSPPVSLHPEFNFVFQFRVEQI